MSLIEPEHTIK